MFANLREPFPSFLQVYYLGTILACPPANFCGKKEEIQHSVTTVKSSEMEVKWRIRLGLGQRSAQGDRER